MKILVNIVSCLIIALTLTGCISTKNTHSNIETKMNLNNDWRYLKLVDNTNEASFHLPATDDSEWKPIRLPHSANIEPLVVNDQWQGISWYRKNLTLPKNIVNNKILIELEAAMNYSQMWVNGQLVKSHQGGYLPVVADITPYIIAGKSNTIALRLDNRDNPITGPKPLNILDFNMYGGLYRNAWLIKENMVYISHPNIAEQVAGGGIFITTPVVSSEQSIIQVKTHVVNAAELTKSIKLIHTLLYKNNAIQTHTVAATDLRGSSDKHYQASIDVKDAKLWSPNSPHLYELKTQVFADGKLVDTERTRFGIREFELRGLDLYINGEKTFLRGVNRHQEYPFVGYAMSDAAQYRDAKKIKDAGFDYIRLSHYPQSTAFLDACDELGLVVLDAILGWQYYGDFDAFRNYTYTSARQLIRRDRNHPSVLAWEVSLNETKMPIFYMQELHKIVKQEYPIKNSYSAGWMDDVYDIYLQARQHRILHDEDRDTSIPYSVSEYGDWEYYSSNAGLNQDKMPKDLRLKTSSRQLRGFGESRLLQQLANIQEAHNDNFNTTAFADSYWVMFDYNRGYHDGLESSGVMDIFRLPKFGYYFFKSQRSPEQEAVLKIASYWNDKSPLAVKILSNAQNVKLYLNNKLIADQTPDSGNNTENLAHPPFTFTLDKFETGELRAVSYINNKIVAQDRVKTPQQPTKLTMWIDESGKAPQKGTNDTVFLYIAAVDKNGTVNPNFSDKINLALSGDVKVLNVGPIKSEAGIATALIQIGDDAEVIDIIASTETLPNENFRFFAN